MAPKLSKKRIIMTTLWLFFSLLFGVLGKAEVVFAEEEVGDYLTQGRRFGEIFRIEFKYTCDYFIIKYILVKNLNNIKNHSPRPSLRFNKKFREYEFYYLFSYNSALPESKVKISQKYQHFWNKKQLRELYSRI